jgi:hypothetical protein
VGAVPQVGCRWPDHPGFAQESRELFTAIAQCLVVRGVRERGPTAQQVRSLVAKGALSPGVLATSDCRSLRAWPLDFPDDIMVQRQPPYESRADSVMYCQVLSECAHVRGWEVHLFDARDVEAQGARILGERAADVLHRPRATLGPPWTKDHRIALASTVVAS